MTAATHRSIQLEGNFTISEPAEQVFPLFSPLGEKAWAPDWSPELIHPPDISWAEGLIFRTTGQAGDAIWIVTRLEAQVRRVTYHRVEGAHLVVRVDVRCQELADDVTRVVVAYLFVSLSAEGDEIVAAMSREGYEEKMRQWKRWIDERRRS